MGEKTTGTNRFAYFSRKLSCTRLRVPPVALHVSQLISWIFIAFCRCSTGVALHPLKIVVSHLPPPVPGGVAPKFGSEKVSRYTGVSQLQLRVSRYTVQLSQEDRMDRGWRKSCKKPSSRRYWYDDLTSKSRGPTFLDNFALPIPEPPPPLQTRILLYCRFGVSDLQSFNIASRAWQTAQITWKAIQFFMVSERKGLWRLR